MVKYHPTCHFLSLDFTSPPLRFALFSISIKNWLFSYQMRKNCNSSLFFSFLTQRPSWLRKWAIFHSLEAWYIPKLGDLEDSVFLVAYAINRGICWLVFQLPTPPLLLAAWVSHESWYHYLPSYRWVTPHFSILFPLALSEQSEITLHRIFS